MGPTVVHYIPIVTTILAVPFAVEIYRRYRAHPERLHLLWWAIGIATYGVGTFTEAFTTLAGWNEPTFRAWYISGALLGGAPLAQGTVYLLLPRRVAHVLTVILIGFVAIASVAVLMSPINYTLVEPHRLTGAVLEWRWVRYFSPFVNLYAVVFLIGGAILSALRYSGNPSTRHRAVANVLIADRRDPARHRRHRDADGLHRNPLRHRARRLDPDVDRLPDERSSVRAVTLDTSPAHTRHPAAGIP